MRLFYIPGACSFGPHVALREAGLSFTLERVRFVDARSRLPIDIMQPGARERGYDLVYGEEAKPFRAINPKGFVPALQLDDGAVLTEGPAIYQYVGDEAPAAALVPRAGSAARARFCQHVAETASGIHKRVSVAMHGVGPENRPAVFAEIAATLDRFARHLDGRDYLLNGFSLADVYLFMNWQVASNVLRRPPSSWPNAAAYLDRLRERPSVRAAAREEGTEARFLAPSR